ncbi:hypothetical protein JL722_13599 [Aureococcus anophagefferens]|nr:hypothetical protein JL722_13599 [Aureococcus anophagefferens]
MASSLKKMLLLALATSQALRLPRLPVAKAPKAKRRALRAAAVASASLAQRAVASTVEAALPAAEVAAEATLVVARGPSPLLNAVRGLATAVFAFSIVNAAAAAPPKKKPRKVLDVFRKKPARPVELEELLTVPAEAALEGPAVAARRFSVAVAGLLISAIPDALVVSPGSSPSSSRPGSRRATPAPWRRRPSTRASSGGRPTRRPWGPRATTTSAPATDGRRDHEATAIPGAGLAGAWAAQCAATGCVSHYDFGVRATAARARAGRRRGARRGAEDAATLAAMVAGLDKAEAAATFANVVNAVLVALVDAAVPSLKRSDAESLPPLQKVVALTAAAGGVFEELGLVEYAGTPVVYEGRASKSQLQSLFSRYAAAGVAAGLSEDGDATAAAADVAMVDTLQAIFAISDKQADRLAQQVVTKLVQQMMEQAQAEDPEGLLEALAGASGPGGMPGMPGMPDPADVEGQMAALQQLVDSGQLGDDDKREIKKMFAEQLGGGDVDEAIRQANANKDQLDPQARQALDLLNKLCL